ncbi:hypothetical protein CL614_10390 [archaeon]|nr:hypothetical protein [archaeon]
MFNEILVSRTDNNDVQQKLFRVPISYGPIQKFLARIEQDPNLDSPTAIVLPRISFEISGINYDGERNLTHLTRNRRVDTANTNAYDTQYTPAPYNIDFTMSVYAKYSEDGTRIIEQIIPFFKPEWTTTVQLVDDMNLSYDVPTILTSVTNEEIYEGGFEERQVILWTLTFTMKTYFFGPVTSKKVIKFANTEVYSTLTANNASESVNVYPQLTSNTAVHWSDIDFDDDWDYKIVIEDA